MTAGRVQCEFSLIRYVPDPVRGEFTNIGVLLREARPGGAAQVRFTRDWRRVRCLHPDADVELLEGLEAELGTRLGVETEGVRPLLDVLGDSLSNSVQMTELRGALAESLPAEMEQLLRMYVEPMAGRGSRTKAATGRTAIVGRMRTEFERVGAWALMRKRVPARDYTRPGDPLRLDCGYRNGQMRMFQAVSLQSDAEAAKGLAYSFEDLQAGVRRVEATELELTAVIEPVAAVSDAELYGFGVGLMEQAGLRVLTTADLGRVAETARRELRV